MNTADAEAILEAFTEARLSLRRTKGASYAGKQDVLANFKRTGERLGISPMKVLGIFMLKHVDSLCSSIASGDHSDCGGESMESRWADLINYAELGVLLMKELEPDCQQNS